MSPCFGRLANQRKKEKRKKKRGGRESHTLKPKTNIYLAITLERRIKKRKRGKKKKNIAKILGTKKKVNEKKNAVNDGARLIPRNAPTTIFHSSEKLNIRQKRIILVKYTRGNTARSNHDFSAMNFCRIPVSNSFNISLSLSLSLSFSALSLTRKVLADLQTSSAGNLSDALFSWTRK